MAPPSKQANKMRADDPVAPGHMILIITNISVWAEYLLSEHLFLSNVLSAGVIQGLAEVTAQTIGQIEGNKAEWRYDFKRSRHSMLVGCVLGVFSHFWYNTIDYYLPGRTVDIVFKKTVLDQILRLPVYELIHLTGMGLLEGQNAGKIYRDCKKLFTSIRKVDWIIWCAAQAVNFYFLPNKYRVLYLSCGALVMSLFTGYDKRKLSFQEKLTPSKSPQRKDRSSPVVTTVPKWSGIKAKPKGRLRNRKRFLLSSGNRDKKRSKNTSLPNDGMSDKKQNRKKKENNISEENMVFSSDIQQNGNIADSLDIQEKLLGLGGQVSEMSEVVAKTRAELDEARMEIAKVNAMFVVLFQTLDEGKRGVVNIALQLKQAVHEEGNKVMDELRLTSREIIALVENKEEEEAYE
ncbi:uncharacterized protein LOC131958268 [Physella acuta]|uniref:uncharacterized protein LOC131958268 n=1 Tax=Physella acuta TaxID=109671 RepID=UPI0027DC6D86|nr:uncharacterized protein LOC131958268 [Physella acuta]